MAENDKRVVIGLEVHVQLNTKSKLFCGCPTNAREPNTAVCEVCLGFPGSKPVLNKKAVDYALKLALALNCKINREFFFSRKTYFYPDMSKNYQITQFELPIGENGFIQLKDGKKVRIKRIHLEEDPAALVHEKGTFDSNYCLVDYNRSGIPLVEVVTEPDIESAEQARAFLDQLITILEYLEIFELGKNTLKADSNVSIEGSQKVEIKNITGFKNVEKALEFEIARQKQILKAGEKVKRETRSFDEKNNVTILLRSKETEEDYGYIMEPDIPMVVVDDNWMQEIKKSLPELHNARAERFEKQFKLDAKVAEVLTSNFELAKLFESVVSEVDAKLAAAFLTRELLAILNRNDLNLKELNLDLKEIIYLLKLLQEKKISEKNAKETMIKYAIEKIVPSEFVEKEKLLKDLKIEEIEKVVEKVLRENKKAVDDFKKGEEKSLNFLVGKVMHETKGKAEARDIKKMIEKKLRG